MDSSGIASQKGEGDPEPETRIALSEENFTDANFRLFVSRYDEDNDGYLSQSEIDSVTELVLQDYSIIKSLKKWIFLMSVLQASILIQARSLQVFQLRIVRLLSLIKFTGINAFEDTVIVKWSITADYTVTVNGNKFGTFKSRSSVELTAPAAPEGKKFSCWKKDGKVVSTSPEYSFILLGDTALTVEYVNSSEVVEEKPVTSLTVGKTTYNKKNALGYTFTHTVPDSYEIKEVGLLYATNKLAGADTTDPTYAATVDLTTTDFGVEAAVKNNTSGRVKKFVANYTNHNGTISFSYAIGANTDCYVYAVGYIKVVTPDNNDDIIYSDFVVTTYDSIS